ncbi:MAG TPA: hypothetical protein DEA63_05235 [Firmicutes bacterium]|nr:hypothetical protein [Bacillota bacterium]
MGNFFFAVGFLAYAFALFRFGYVTMGANRAFYGLFGGIVESSVVQLNVQGEMVAPYFDFDILHKRINLHFQETLGGLCEYAYRVSPADPIRKEIDPLGLQAAIVELNCYWASGDRILSKRAFFSLMEAY